MKFSDIRPIGAVRLASLSIMFTAAGMALAQGTALPTLEPGKPMSEELRVALKRVVIKPAEEPGDEEIAGDYQKDTYDLYSGAAVGAGASTIHKQAGPVNLSIPIPILQLPGMIAGGIAGATQEQIQEFRDALTKDLAEASSQQIVNDRIAADVYEEIRTAPTFQADVFALETPIPEATDAVLSVGVRDIIIQVDGKEAIITATVDASLHRPGEESAIYETSVSYQDRDTLGNWTGNDNAAWRNYANFARHYIGREIASLVFNSAALDATMVPVKTSTVSLSKRNPWQASSKTRKPTLAWELDISRSENDSEWVDGVDDWAIYYDLEIYDLQRPVYSAQRISGKEHTVAMGLKPCQRYRWSVRPSFHVNGVVRHGEWMRSGFNGNGNIGEKASQVPAYLNDFAEFEIRCGSK